MKVLTIISIIFLVTIFSVGLYVDHTYKSNFIDGMTVLGIVGIFATIIFLTLDKQMNEIPNPKKVE